MEIERAGAAVAVAEVPKASTILAHLKRASGFEAACRRVPGPRPEGVLCFALPRGLVAGLRAAAKEAIGRYGLHGWLTRKGWQSSYYESLSLTYNPELRDRGMRDVHQSTLGTSANLPSEFYYGSVHRLRELKNSYFDTYGFRRPTPAARIGALGKFLSECRLSLVRSRLSVLYGDEAGRIGFDFGWHRDEPVFENLRLNIPLVAHPSYRLQIEHEADVPSADSPDMSTHYLKTGCAYTFDTHRPHRVFPARPCRIMRVHLVLGFAPWFRYDAASDRWSPNEYFGRVHPFEIVRGGGLHPALEPVPDLTRIEPARLAA
jgi:hypothetical protein